MAKHAKHSPLPWKVSADRSIDGEKEYPAIYDADDNPVLESADAYYPAFCSSANEDEDAAFIVKAVNSHDALVSCLHQTISDIRGIAAWTDDLDLIEMCQQIASRHAEAIAKAKGE